jgi:hypothetical protein
MLSSPPPFERSLHILQVVLFLRSSQTILKLQHVLPFALLQNNLVDWDVVSLRLLKPTREGGMWSPFSTPKRACSGITCGLPPRASKGCRQCLNVSPLPPSKGQSKSYMCLASFALLKRARIRKNVEYSITERESEQLNVDLLPYSRCNFNTAMRCVCCGLLERHSEDYHVFRFSPAFLKSWEEDCGLFRFRRPSPTTGD